MDEDRTSERYNELFNTPGGGTGSPDSNFIEPVVSTSGTATVNYERYLRNKAIAWKVIIVAIPVFLTLLLGLYVYYLESISGPVNKLTESDGNQDISILELKEDQQKNLQKLEDIHQEIKNIKN